MPEAPENRSRTAALVFAALVGLAYFAGAELGHFLSFKGQDQAFATFWPPAGILLAGLARSPWRNWPALLGVTAVANTASNVLMHDMSVFVSLGFTAANLSEACLALGFLRVISGHELSLARVRDVLWFACLAILCTLLGGAIGAGVVAITAPNASFGSAWQMWAMTDTVGMLVVAPVLLTWSADSAAALEIARPVRILEALALAAGLIVAAHCVFGGLLPAPLNVPAFVLPFLLWAGFRFGPPGAAAALLVAAVIGVGNTSQGRGPYAAIAAAPGEAIVRAQATLCAINLTILVLVAAVEERKALERQKSKLIADLERALGEIKTLQGLIPVCAWCKKVRNDQGFWQLLEDYLKAHTPAEFTHGICPECLVKEVAVAKNVDPNVR